jgi:polysaccharide export outer membrane protein
MLRLIRLAGLSLALAGLACAAPPSAEEFEKPPELSQQPYVFGAGDVLDVRVWKNPELSAEAAVRPDGQITLPLVGDVVADGLTSEELTKVIREKLSEYITNPDVFVGLKQAGSKRVYVIGEVAHGGPIPLASELRVMDVIAISGGFSPFADKGDVRIIRREGGQEREYRFDYDAYVSGDAPGTNVVLRPGDTVVVHD